MGNSPSSATSEPLVGGDRRASTPQWFVILTCVCVCPTDHCYKRFSEHYVRLTGGKEAFSIAKGDWFAFHSPFTKLVQKSFARLLLNDFLSEQHPDTSEGLYAGLKDFV